MIPTRLLKNAHLLRYAYSGGIRTLPSFRALLNRLRRLAEREFNRASRCGVLQMYASLFG